MFLEDWEKSTNHCHDYTSWEYPGGSGVECNVASPNDTANYLAFLQMLSEDPVGKNLVISAAVPLNTFIGTDGKPMTDVSAFAKVLYDIGASSALKLPTNYPMKN